jgi:NADPH:quinone reductase-like Zn-dependent oxidoreductase
MAPSTMRAVVRDRYGSPDVARVDEVPRPVPRPGDVLVRVRAASLNTADLDYLRGVPLAVRLFAGWRMPRNRKLGLDVAGEVEAVGDGVALVPGDRVFADLFEQGMGAFADYVCARESAFHRVPAGLGLEDAATLPHSGILALQALGGPDGVASGARVLINGAGGVVGPFAIQLAHAAGAEVTAVDRGDKLDLPRSLGVERTLDFTAQDVTRDGQRYDLVVDIAARRPALAFRRTLADGGRYTQVARSLSGLAATVVLGGLATVGSSRRMGVRRWFPNRADHLEHLAGLVVEGKLRPVIDRRVPLEDVPAALAYLADGRARGKVVVTGR